jgi:hypothetical protein
MMNLKRREIRFKTWLSQNCQKQKRENIEVKENRALGQ